MDHIQRKKGWKAEGFIQKEEPEKTFSILYNELKKFSKILVKKPYVILLTKIDLEIDFAKKVKRFNRKKNILTISAVTGKNLAKTKDIFYQLILKADQIEEM